jgi:hypothetical protein
VLLSRRTCCRSAFGPSCGRWDLGGLPALTALSLASAPQRQSEVGAQRALTWRRTPVQCGNAGVMSVVSGREDFARRLDRVLSVGLACAGALMVALFLPGLVLWAVTGDEEAGRNLVRIMVGWCFGPLALFGGLLWFAVPYWGTSRLLRPSAGKRWTAVGTGACFWGLGVGFSASLVGPSALFAVRLGLAVGLLGVLVGWLLTRWLGRLVSRA